MPDLGATSDCLTNNRKTEDKKTRYYCFFSVISIEILSSLDLLKLH